MAVRTSEKMEKKQERLLRLKEVLRLIPVSKSTWWAGCKNGRFPKPIHLGPRVTCWRQSEILALMDQED